MRKRAEVEAKEPDIFIQYSVTYYQLLGRVLHVFKLFFFFNVRIKKKKKKE